MSRERGSCACQQAAGGESRQQEQELSRDSVSNWTQGTKNAKKLSVAIYYRSCLHVTVAGAPFCAPAWYTRRHSRASNLRHRWILYNRSKTGLLLYKISHSVVYNMIIYLGMFTSHYVFHCIRGSLLISPSDYRDQLFSIRFRCCL